MRQERTVQSNIFDLFAEHEIGRELKAMSQWLDRHRELLSLVAQDLRRHGVKETGRQGLPAEAVLRLGQDDDGSRLRRGENHGFRAGHDTKALPEAKSHRRDDGSGQTASWDVGIATTRL